MVYLPVLPIHFVFELVAWSICQSSRSILSLSLLHGLFASPPDSFVFVLLLRVLFHGLFASPPDSFCL